MLKRLIDIFLSGVALVLLTIPLAIIAVLVRLDSSGSPFFKQERSGKDGKRFVIWKFRTMADGSANLGLGVRTSRDDDRITRVGRFLRMTSLDEVPQLINVFLGDMSLVGPRPTLPYQVETYNAHQRRRLEVRPGITSLASVKGRNSLSWQDRIEFDIWYVDHQSLWVDVKILFRTLWVGFVTREGVYAETGANDDFVSVEPETGTEGAKRR